MTERPNTKRGWVELQFRREGLPIPTRVTDLMTRDYEPSGMRMPLQEVNNLNELFDLAYMQWEVYGLPRQTQRHDILAFQVTGQPVQAMLLVDPTVQIVGHPADDGLGTTQQVYSTLPATEEAVPTRKVMQDKAKAEGWTSLRVDPMDSQIFAAVDIPPTRRAIYANAEYPIFMWRVHGRKWKLLTKEEHAK